MFFLGGSPKSTACFHGFAIFLGRTESSPRQLKALRCMRIVDTDRLLLAREDGCSSDGCGRVTVRVGRIESLPFLGGLLYTI